jgi:NTP pyrophosphatase (non-canonical NTP hydrolase)
MTTNEYQDGAMSTCLPACNNTVYMLNGLTAEVGEINDKVAKWVRKGIARIDNNMLVFNTGDTTVRDEYIKELIKEIGDCAWFLAGLSKVLGVSFEEVCQGNLNKLADRKKEGTIISHTDH